MKGEFFLTQIIRRYLYKFGKFAVRDIYDEVSSKTGIENNAKFRHSIRGIISTMHRNGEIRNIGYGM